MKKTIYVIAAPTASGKSEFSVKLAKKINGVVVNADSMQVYKNLNVLTARPQINDMKNIDHFLYGYVDGSLRYNVKKWCIDATNVINKTFENKKIPILVGGTGLYINTLFNGLVDIPPIPEKIKIESDKIIKKFGKNFLIDKIKNIDPISLREINTNDNVRLRRIWEVFEFTGKKFSEWKQNQNKNFFNNYNYKIILFLPDRKKNYEIVNARFAKMINEGAVEEVKQLLELDLHHSFPVMRAHGVPEIIKYLKNDITMDECITKGQQVTRNYVKRQHTWWKSSNLEIFQKFDKFPAEIDLKSIKFD